jgi:hypothetical protein
MVDDLPANRTNPMPDPMIEAMARAIYYANGEDGSPECYMADAQAAYAVSGCDSLLKRVSELEEALRPFASHAQIVDADKTGFLETPDFDGWSLLAKDFVNARATLSRGE